MISALHQKSKFKFQTFLKKKNQFLGFPWCSTREDHSIDVSITIVGLILTKLRWFQLFIKSQNSNFKLFGKKNQIFWFPWCSTREDLSVDVSITYVGLILTKPGRFFFLAYGNSGYGENSISSILNFLKKFHISGFPWCSTREDHSIGVSITIVGLILMKLRWFQLFIKSQNSNFKLFWTKIKFLGFHGVVLVKTIPLMYQLLL